MSMREAHAPLPGNFYTARCIHRRFMFFSGEPMTSHLPRSHGFSRRQLLIAGSAGAATAVLPAAVHAQAYPGNKPITIVVGYPPGGSTDLTARTVGAELAKKLGTAVVIENVGGAGGTIGAQKVASAAADGYTLLVGANNEMAISHLVSSNVKYNPLTGFTPIGLIASQPMVLVAANRMEVKDTEGFIKMAKSNPGKFSYGSSGVGTALNLAGEMVKESAGIFMTHIPYRGVAPLTNDLIGGQLEFGVFVLSSGLPHIRSNKVVALGVTENKRSQAAPNIPSLAEHPALKNVNISSWFGLWGPGNLPAPIAQRLQAALGEVMATADVRKKLEDTGASFYAPGQSLADYQKAEIAKYERVVKFAKIKES
jgi:tripartite-type tricarboxylate transporter receptor subunit TctC